MWNTFKTYDLSPEDAFETLNNQLFERYLHVNHSDDLLHFRVINGSGGDGGIEAYGLMRDGSLVCVQSKWFRNKLDESQISQIKKSVHTAMNLRPSIKKYIICIPRNINSLKIGKGKTPIKNSEESRIDSLIEQLSGDYPKLEIVWWFDYELGKEVQRPENEGIHKYWFEREIMFFRTLKDRLQMQKTNSWLRERYVPNLNSSGLIQKQISKQVFSEPFRKEVVATADRLRDALEVYRALLDPLLRHSAERSYYKLVVKISDCMGMVNNYLKQIKLMAGSGVDGTLDLSFFDNDIYDDLDELRQYLKKSMPTNLEKPSYDKLILKLEIMKSELFYGFETLCSELERIPCCIIYGRAGTGKTHGLAFGVEEYLNSGCPAILIRAYGANSKSWESLLCSELGLPEWNLTEIFSALETLAHRNDVKRSNEKIAGKKRDFELSKVLICIDGLEEDMSNWDNWYDRISEMGEIARKFTRVRILFSARDYFYNNSRIPDSGFLNELRLPREGDVKIIGVLPKYLEEYKISLADTDFVRGLDSLFALRLFCEQYRGMTIMDSHTFETATGTLLNLKLKRLSDEFLRLIGKKNLDAYPVSDALLLISEMFYSHPELSHREIKGGVFSELQHYLDNSEMELLLQFLSENGILTRVEREEGKGIIKRYEKYYAITYQSILEIVLSDKITNTIIENDLLDFPNIVFQNFALPPDMNPIEFRRKYNKTPNQQLIQNVANSVFLQTRKLIGSDGFLEKGFNKKEVFEMQLEALIAAPYELAEEYRPWITGLLNTDYNKRYVILKSLIYPLANRRDTPFNTLYLHQLLSEFPNAFSRDKFWSGLDSYEKSHSNNKPSWSLAGILNSYVDLSEDEKHDGRPLMYAWGLSTLDQKLREDIRVKLAKWALLAPTEFMKILDKLFDCNDPQIQEDLAAVVLAIASRSKDSKAIGELAKWSNKNIFDRRLVNRNVIVRYGFGASVERAFQLKLIGEEELQKARPSRLPEFATLPLDSSFLKNPREEFYPIVHDLAWYVIRDAYDKFLAYEVGYGKEGMTEETAAFIKKHDSVDGAKNEIGCREWAMAAALSYVGILGLDRKSGSGFTQASHGSKSKVFTYEEKYVWLAVNFIKGYLSDYLPYNDGGDKFWIKDYSLIAEIHNPSEDFYNGLEEKIDGFFSPSEWLIPAVLAPEIPVGADVGASIQNIVNSEPLLKFEDWILYERSDFDFLEHGRQGAVLHNYTGLYNSTNTVHSSVQIQCCIISLADFPVFKETIQASFNSRILQDDLQFYASPQTDIYSNPSDIVWMDWIGEEGGRMYLEDIAFDAALSKVVKKNVEGEEEVYLPSKQVRKALGIVALDGSDYLDIRDSTVGTSRNVKTKVFGESQELLIVDDSLLKTNLGKNGLMRFWFALTIVNKNSINAEIDEVPFCQKVRKYLVWEEEGRLKCFKFWDKMFSNE